MKQFVLLSLLTLFTAIFVLFACRQKTSLPPEKEIAQILLSQVDSFATSCDNLQAAVVNSAVNEEQLQQFFLQARQAYKRFEWAAEYFEPATSRAVNGPPVQEVELSGAVFEPSGLQVTEGILFPTYDTTQKPELLKQLSLIQKGCNRYNMHFSNIDMFNWQIFDAVKQEIFRIETLGITGFDNPLTLQSMQESAVSLRSVQRVINYYTDQPITKDIKEQFEAATKYLISNTDFNTFNRAAFITNYCNPLTTVITNLEKRLNIHVIRYNRLLNQDAKTLFDSNAFNVNAYTPDPSSFVTNKKIALGKLLFTDPILSGNGKRSCQSCHQPDKAFTDGLVKNTIIDKKEMLRRNTPTLINAALQSAQFYDLRANTLENQSLDVVQSAVEMHGSMKLTVHKLWRDSSYRQLFAAAFPRKNRNSIDTSEVMNAIGSYVRSLTLLNSRFDEYMRGNKNALNADEINGFNLFMGKAKCGTCHYMPLFNGTLPPRYMKTESEVIGVPQSLAANTIDSDMGRYDILHIAAFEHSFKIPTVRNAARTAPYMHNGVFTTLEQVIDFYNEGGGAGLGMKIDNQTLSFGKLNLTQQEKDALIAFMKSLDSR